MDLTSLVVDLLVCAAIFLVSTLLLVRWVRMGKAGWLKCSAASGIVMALLMAGNAWIRLPQATASRLVGILREGPTDELATRIAPPAVWRSTADGSLEIVAEDGTFVMVPKQHLPLLPFGNGQRRSLGDLVSGRWRFQLASSNGVFCRIDCTAQWGRIYCHHVEVF
jgi:hypothetical protein